MILGDKANDAQLVALLPSITHHMNEWQIVTVNILKDSKLSQRQVIEKLLVNYEKYEGLIYVISASKIILLARLGAENDYVAMKTEIEKKLPRSCCRVMLRKMNELGIRQVQIDLMAKEDGVRLADNMFVQRQRRKNNVILIADDDSFVRLSMSKLLAGAGEVVMVDDGEVIVSEYLKHNPDILFLDIHMPGKTGLELTREIIAFDPDAYIVILSADSSVGNVMTALEEGAVGFLSKPPPKNKVQDYISQCITMK